MNSLKFSFYMSNFIVNCHISCNEDEIMNEYIECDACDKFCITFYCKWIKAFTLSKCFSFKQQTQRRLMKIVGKGKGSALVEVSNKWIVNSACLSDTL